MKSKIVENEDKKLKIVINKKTGKVYTYDPERYAKRRGLLLVSEKGRVYKKSIEKIKAQIDANKDYGRAQKIAYKSDLDAYVQLRLKQGRRGTSAGFFGKQTQETIPRIFTNAGYTTDEVAKKIGISEDELLDPRNWTPEDSDKIGSILRIKETDDEGNEIEKSYQFKFTYTGDILTEVK